MMTRVARPRVALVFDLDRVARIGLRDFERILRGDFDFLAVVLLDITARVRVSSCGIDNLFPNPLVWKTSNRSRFDRRIPQHVDTRVEDRASLISRSFRSFLVIRNPIVHVRHSLAFYGTLSFVAGFFGARLFATLNPAVVVERGGIHFHHFWYGLGMIVVSGWMGIATNDDRISRYLAVVFGLGAGFVGDEVGLLLTFGDYSEKIALQFFVAAIAFIILVTLFAKYHDQIERDVLTKRPKYHLAQVGLFLALFSTIFLAFGMLTLGLALTLLGVLLFLVSFEYHRDRTNSRQLARF